MRTTISTTCTTCGREATAGTALYLWSMTQDAGRRTWTCVPCSREHLPCIEGRAAIAW